MPTESRLPEASAPHRWCREGVWEEEDARGRDNAKRGGPRAEGKTRAHPLKDAPSPLRVWMRYAAGNFSATVVITRGSP